MADNVSANGIPVATRSVSYSGDANQNAQVVGLVTFTGSDDAKTATDLTLGQAAMAGSLPVGIASDQSPVSVNGARTVTLTGATWNSGTADETTVTLNTEGYRFLRISFPTNTAASGSLELLRNDELMAFYLTDPTINDSWIRLTMYVFNGTIGDIYVDTGGAAEIKVRLNNTISSGTLTWVPVVSPERWAGPTGLKAEDEASVAMDFGMPAMAVRKATPANTSGADGDYEMLQMSGGRLWTHAVAVGDVAHDAADSGNPVKMGARAIAHGSNPTAVAAADRTDLLANRAGVPFVIGGHPNVQTIKHANITTAVTDAVIISVSAGTKIVVTAYTVTLDNASTVFPTVLIGFGSANTPTTTGVIGAHGGVPAGGGFSRGDGSGIIGIGGDGEDLRVTTTGNATGNGLQIVVTYYTIES